MALSGLKKQLNKANQFLTEKVSGVEGTKLHDEYLSLEKSTDLINGLVEDLQSKTKDYLQLHAPILSLGGPAKATPGGILAESMVSYGLKLEDNPDTKDLAQAIKETGESLRRMDEMKSLMDDSVKENFLKPLGSIQSELKEAKHRRDKVKSHRLDFDSKKQRQEQPYKHGSGKTISDEEMKMAAKKFGESYQRAQIGMQNALEKNKEIVVHLSALADNLRDYHMQCAEILNGVSQVLEIKKQEVGILQPGKPFTPKVLKDLEKYLDANESSTKTLAATPPVRPPFLSTPTCKALYEFTSENSAELQFKLGDTIQLLRRVDENWFEGTLNGKVGIFPVNYVKILVPLP